MSVEPRCEYAPGDPILIRNIVTELKAQGVFDQFRKECISDVDTKPAYQNLCHRVDGQIDSYLSEIRWGTDLTKNQLRDKLRKYVNEFNYVESGITRIVDQLVNPRINTILVPKVEDIVYEYLGIPRPEKGVSNDSNPPAFDVKSLHFDDKSNDSVSSKSRNDCKTNSTSTDEQKGKNFDEIFRDNADANLVETGAVNSKPEKNIEQPNDEAKKEETHTSLSNIESDEENLDDVEMTANAYESSAPLSQSNRRDEMYDDMSDEDDEDDISPPFEPLVKSDPETSVFSPESNYSPDVLDSADKNVQPLSVNAAEETQNGQNLRHPSIETNETVSLDSAPTATPADIPKTPTIHYETSSPDDNDSGAAKHNSQLPLPPPAIAQELPELTKCEPLPDLTNTVKVEEKTVEENREKKEEKRDGSSSRSRHSSRDSRHRDRKHHSDRHKRDKERRRSAERSKDDGKERRGEKHEDRSKDDRKHKEGSRSSSKHDKDRRDDKKSSSSSSSKHHHHHHHRHHSESSRDDEKKRKKSGDSGGEAKNIAKDACGSDQKTKQDRRSSDRDSNGQPPATSSSSSSGLSHQREKHSDKSKVSSSSSLHHKWKKTDTKKTKNGENPSKISNGLKNGVVKDGKAMGSSGQVKKMDKSGTKRQLEHSNHERSSAESKGAVQKTSDNLMEELTLKKPKIARNQTEFGKVVKLRKQLKEKIKRLREKAARERSKSSVKKEVSLSVTRVDTKFKIVEGRCQVDEQGLPRSPLVNDDNNNKNANTRRDAPSDDEEMPLEPEDELGNVNIEEVIGCRTNLARLTIKKEEEKTTAAGGGEYSKENISIDRSQLPIVDGFEYFKLSTNEANEEFKKFVHRALSESLDVQVENFSITMPPYPERYDAIFREQLNAVVERNGQSSVKYNSEIMHDEGIMLRIKMSHRATKSSSKDGEKQSAESDDERGSSTRLHNGQLTFKSTDEESNVSDSSLSTRQMESECDDEPSKMSFTKRKTVTKRKLSKTSSKNQKTSIVDNDQPPRMMSVEQEESKTSDEANSIASRLSGEIETTFENSSASCEKTVNVNFTVPSTPLKTQKPQRKVPRRAPSLSNSHYDISDLYKPRLSFLFSSRRSRGMNNSENK